MQLVEVGVLEGGEQFVKQIEQLRCSGIGELGLGKPDGRAVLVHRCGLLIRRLAMTLYAGERWCGTFRRGEDFQIEFLIELGQFAFGRGA